MGEKMGVFPKAVSILKNVYNSISNVFFTLPRNLKAGTKRIESRFFQYIKISGNESP